MGVAVLDGSDLIDWGVKVIEGKWSSDKLAKIANVVSRLITDYQPSVMAIKKTHSSRTSSQLDKVCRQIKLIAQNHRLELRQYSIEDIKVFHGQSANAGKTKLAELVSIKYPVLIRELRKEQNASNSYHIRMFEAVALATACLINTSKPHNCPVMFNMV